jgi:hypothetical protein
MNAMMNRWARNTLRIVKPRRSAKLLRQSDLDTALVRSVLLIFHAWVCAGTKSGFGGAI